MRLLDVRIGNALGITIDVQSAVQVLAGTIIAGVALSGVFLFELWTRLLVVDRVGDVATLSTDISTPIVVAFIEEFIFRAVLLGCFILWFRNSDLAVALSAVIFSAAHLANPHVETLAIIGYLIGGYIYGIAYLRSGRVWLPIGLHFGWNYAEGRVFGFPLSGGRVIDPFITQHNIGPTLWTGGEYGPEASLIGLVARFAILFLTLGWLISQQVKFPLGSGNVARSLTSGSS